MDMDQRLAVVEQKVEGWLMLDARLKAIEESIKKMNPKSSVRDWVQTLSPFVTAIAVFIVGFVLKDSVTQALEREKLDLSYVSNVRELIAGFDAAEQQSTADSNAIALAMYGRFSIVPLVERLQGGDVAQLAAERGLRIVGSEDPEAACAAFTRILQDPARQYTWQTHQAVVRLMGASECVPQLPVLETYLVDLPARDDPALLATFARRFSNEGGFDAENSGPFREQLRTTMVILRDSRARAARGEKTWWK
jgi:hypothetical protein